MASKEALEKEAAMQAERADLRAERDHAREEKSAVEATLASSMQALAIIRAARDEEKLAVMLVRKACVSLVCSIRQADDTEHQLRLGFSGEKTAGLVQWVPTLLAQFCVHIWPPKWGPCFRHRGRPA